MKNSQKKPITTRIRHYAEDVRTVRAKRADLERYGLAYFNFWKLGPIEQSWFYRFLQRPALKDLAVKQQVAFFSVFGRKRLLSMSGVKHRIFFAGEDLARFPEYQHLSCEEASLSLGFDLVERDCYLRFPLWLLDLFPPEATLTDLTTRMAQFDSASQDFAQRKAYAVLFASHDKTGLRSRMADAIAPFGPVSYPGRFRNNVAEQFPTYADKLTYLQSFRYNICPENTNATGYVTEKLFHAVAAGCIPIYWGSGQCPEPDIFNQKAILFFDEQQPGHLQSQLHSLEKDDARQTSFARQRKFQPGAPEAVFAYYQALENELKKILA